MRSRPTAYRKRRADDSRRPRQTIFTSTTGVPSIASSGPTRRLVPSIDRIVTRCRPSGFGRCGERVAKTPVSGCDGVVARMRLEDAAIGAIEPGDRAGWRRRRARPARPGAKAGSMSSQASGAPSSPWRGASVERAQRRSDRADRRERAERCRRKVGHRGACAGRGSGRYGQSRRVAPRRAGSSGGHAAVGPSATSPQRRHDPVRRAVAGDACAADVHGLSRDLAISGSSGAGRWQQPSSSSTSSNSSCRRSGLAR